VESVYEFGSRVGFWRLLRIFQQRNIPITVFGCALALERIPAAQAIVEAGYDICCHGWLGAALVDERRGGARRHRKGIASIAKITGSRPLGWYCERVRRSIHGL